MMKEYTNPIVPEELVGEDVYDIPYEFDTEEEAIDYYSKTYNVDKEEVYRGLHEDDDFYKDFPPTNVKETLKFYAKSGCSFGIQEMFSKKYVLVEFY